MFIVWFSPGEHGWPLILSEKNTLRRCCVSRFGSVPMLPNDVSTANAPNRPVGKRCRHWLISTDCLANRWERDVATTNGWKIWHLQSSPRNLIRHVTPWLRPCRKDSGSIQFVKPFLFLRTCNCCTTQGGRSLPTATKSSARCMAILREFMLPMRQTRGGISSRP